MTAAEQQISPVEWTADRNDEWRRALRRASLIAEVEIADEDLDQSIDYFGRFLSNKTPEQFRKKFPAFFVVVLTQVGMREWAQNTFYDRVADALHIDHATAEQLTREFHHALVTLGLPLFDDVEGHRWITPVLLHGGIPLDHLDELLVLLKQRRQRDRTLTGGSFVEWARLAPGALIGQPKPLERFLLHGGEFAPDFVARVLDFVDDLPSALTQASRERLQYLVDHGYTLPRGQVAERPRIRLTDDDNVVIVLPSVKPAEGRLAQWRVTMGQRTQAVDVSVPYRVDAELTERTAIDINGPVTEITVERGDQTVTLPFVQSQDPLLVFDADGELLPATRSVPAGRLRVMHPDGMMLRSVHGEPVDIEPNSVPYGWQRWTAGAVEVPVDGGLRLGDGPMHRARANDRARLELAPAVDGLFSLDHDPVLSSRPIVRLPDGADAAVWSVTVLDDHGRLVRDIRPTGGVVDPFVAQTHPAVGTFTVKVRGPLGRGITRRFTVAEGAAVTFSPRHRGLRFQGGLDSCTATVRCGADSFERVLHALETATTVPIRGVDLMVKPPHTDLALVFDGGQPQFGIDVASIVPAQVADATIVVRHPGQAGANLEFVTLSGTQISQPTVRQNTLTFPLRAFSGFAKDAGTGAFSLLLGERRMLVARVRPPVLARDVAYYDGALLVDTIVRGDLEVVAYRLAAPWEDGVALTIIDGAAELPARLRSGGPLRVQVRERNDWVPEPVNALPTLCRDVFDLHTLPWSPQTEASPYLGLVAFMLREPGARPESASFARVLDVVGTLPPLSNGLAGPGALHGLLGSRPHDTLGAVRASSADARQLIAALVSSGLVAAPIADLDRPDLVQDLLARAPEAAMLAASAELTRHPDGRFTDLLAATWGGDFEALIAGTGAEEAKWGRFEPAMAHYPEMVKAWYDMLAPVPRSLLDADTRVAAAFELWNARKYLLQEAGAARACVEFVARLIKTRSERLGELIWARYTEHGLLALPTLSFALALAARLASRGDANARQFYERLGKKHHIGFARHAPLFTSIDIVRAEAALIGELR